MTSDELAKEIAHICLEAIQRVKKEGDLTYTVDNRQRFEDETMDDNLRGLEEELLDCINWSAMALIKLRSARAQKNRHAESS